MGLGLQSRPGLTTLDNFIFLGKLEEAAHCMRVSIFVQRSRKNLFLLSFDPGWIDCTCDHQIYFFSETLFVRLISSSSIDALLILLHGCHAESFSNKQGQELSYLDIKFIKSC